MRRIALRAARHDLVLLYHRLGTEREGQVVPTVSPERLGSHLDVLQASGTVVSLSELLAGTRRPGPRFAVTFDDDYASHADAALPVLAQAGAPATFFLCGRALHGLGALWWERLEALLAVAGTQGAAQALGTSVTDPQALAAMLEDDSGGQRRVVEASPDGPSPLGLDGIRALVAAGMGIGYHTLDHPVLTSLDGPGLHRALVGGRDRLAEEAGIAVEQIAYPHGKADRRVAAASRRAGYAAGWTGWPAPLRAGSDRFLLPRWEPGHLDQDAFASALVVRLHRTAPAHRQALRG